MSVQPTTTLFGARKRQKRRGIVTRTLSGLAACTGIACLALLTTTTAYAGDQPEPTSSVPTPIPGPPDPNPDPGEGTAGGLDATSVALGALGGIALGGAGLGVTLAVQRRRDHTALHSA
jgi:hypothetical protein